MGATLGKYSAQDLLAATEGVKWSAQLRKNLKAKLDALGQDEYVIPIQYQGRTSRNRNPCKNAGDKLGQLHKEEY